MKRQLLFLTSGIVALSSLSLPPGAAADCATSSATFCADVAYGKDGDPPSVKPEKIVAKKKATGGGTNEFAFAMAGNADPNVYVVFKCQNYDPDNLDCRTPAVIQHGGNSHPTWSIKLTAGNLKKVRINPVLAGCDACENMPADSVMQQTCIETYCRYPYMVVDVTVASPGQPSLFPPQDPEIIIDPR